MSLSQWLNVSMTYLLFDVYGNKYDLVLKSDSYLPKIFLLFASLIAFQKRWKMLFISS